MIDRYRKHAGIGVIAILFGVFGVPGAANASRRHLDLTPQGEHQRSRMDAGAKAVDSALEHSSVRILENEDKIANEASSPLLPSTVTNYPRILVRKNVSVSLADGTAVAVIPNERLLSEAKNPQMWAAIAAGIRAASNNMAASQAGR